ncbi:GIY-YIG nuclease family protein [Poseidonocella sp. HB161398]|uniref:GIY-YIG nuclease family protein n=1 Tax=Poseidonocella sp. HB161398 TaxID=2320855 RepID=UPI00110995D2|nr:GIY-YIG nuclease family protein [Poseidonocella sp. HB161398]
MTLAPKDAEAALLARYGGPAKVATKKVIGFRTPVGRLLAFDLLAKKTRIWFQPPAPPPLDGVQLLPKPDNGHSNLDPFKPLKHPGTQRVLIDSLEALLRFVDWYDGKPTAAAIAPALVSAPVATARSPGPSASDATPTDDEDEQAYSPSRGFPGSEGTYTATRKDGDTFLYLAKYEGDGNCLLSRAKLPGNGYSVLKIGVSNDLQRRLKEINLGFPPAAKKRWAIAHAVTFENRKAAEDAEQAFKDNSAPKLESLGDEYFWGEESDALQIWARIAGVVQP